MKEEEEAVWGGRRMFARIKGSEEEKIGRGKRRKRRGVRTKRERGRRMRRKHRNTTEHHKRREK